MSINTNDQIQSTSTANSLEETPTEQEIPTNSDPDDMSSTLSIMQKIGYGLGHVFNDLCAGVWFSYTLLYLQEVLSMPAESSGALVMVGQVGDALATAAVGWMADKYGTKQKWHMAGTGLVFFAFPVIFSLCPWCTTAPLWWRPVYFTIVILIFQLGWAIVQITHLAMIPELSRTRKDRSDLTAIRYSASVCANLTVYLVTWGMLNGRGKDERNIGQADAPRFRDIALILTLTGIVMTVLFHFSLFLNDYGIRRRNALAQSSNTRSRRQSNGSIENADDQVRLIGNRSTISQTNFLKSPLLYQNALLYVFSRLFMTTSLIYIPLWLDERSWSRMPQPIPTSATPFAGLSLYFSEVPSVEHIATVPLVSFIASFIASIAIRSSGRLFGHRIAYFVGSLTGIGGCVWVALAAPATASSIRLFGIAILFGAASSITMISSLCITADMIGKHVNQGGFIYSAVTFADKLITGLAVVAIEAWKCTEHDKCPIYYQNVLSYACGGAAACGIFILFTLKCNRICSTSS